MPIAAWRGGAGANRPPDGLLCLGCQGRHDTTELHCVRRHRPARPPREARRLDVKHGSRSRRRWRKLHIGINTDTHEVVVAELTPDDVGDVSTVAGLLEQIDNRVASLTADGAYDGEAVYDAVTKRHPAAAVI